MDSTPTPPGPAPLTEETAQTILARLELIDRRTQQIEAHAAQMAEVFGQLSSAFGDLGAVGELMPGGLGALLGGNGQR